MRCCSKCSMMEQHTVLLRIVHCAELPCQSAFHDPLLQRILMLSRGLLRSLSWLSLGEAAPAPVAITRACISHPVTKQRHTPSRRSSSSSSSSQRWQNRQSRDRFSRSAKVLGLKSRAAFKLTEVRESSTAVLLADRVASDQIDDQYRIFAKAQTVVDLVSSLSMPSRDVLDPMAELDLGICARIMVSGGSSLFFSIITLTVHRSRSNARRPAAVS